MEYCNFTIILLFHYKRVNCPASYTHILINIFKINYYLRTAEIASAVPGI